MKSTPRWSVTDIVAALSLSVAVAVLPFVLYPFTFGKRDIYGPPTWADALIGAAWLSWAIVLVLLVLELAARSLKRRTPIFASTARLQLLLSLCVGKAAELLRRQSGADVLEQPHLTVVVSRLRDANEVCR